MSRLARLALTSVLLAGCRGDVEQVRIAPTPEVLTQQCQDIIGEPRIEEVSPSVLVAIGYDLANTVVIRTPEGNVVIDPGMSPARAREARAALLERAPGNTRAIIYTHSHIDHVGGASVWLDDDTEIWATEAFREHFLKQYGLFMQAEQRRGALQFGTSLADEHLPCIAIGRRIDLDSALESGVRLPTHTFAGKTKLNFGGTVVHLVEAHGETHDQLFAWLPSESVLMAGDNVYHAFPNLYTIRGTRPRPVDDWVQSLDAMRRRAPEHLVPSHTPVVHGSKEVATRLTDYRDAIQWIHHEVVRRANEGDDLETIVAAVGLPRHLAEKPYLRELYGQVDWSVRAIYTNELGWFDGRTDALYPVPDAEAREVALMGGAEAVRTEAERALAEGDARWAVHLLSMLSRLPKEEAGDVDPVLANALEALGHTIYNTNGRAYLLQSAKDLREGSTPPKRPQLDDATLAGVPVDRFLTIMTGRLIPEAAIDVHETLAFDFTDTSERYTLTVRRGVPELAKGDPLPGTPEPVATISTDTMTWKRLALKRESSAAAIAAGRMTILGSKLDFIAFIRRFDRSLE